MHSHINGFPTKNEILFQQLDEFMYEKLKDTVFTGKKLHISGPTQFKLCCSRVNCTGI